MLGVILQPAICFIGGATPHAKTEDLGDQPAPLSVTWPIRIPTRSNLAPEVNSQTPGNMENIQKVGAENGKDYHKIRTTLTMAS
jgi:hypothetical protein